MVASSRGLGRSPFKRATWVRTPSRLPDAFGTVFRVNANEKKTAQLGMPLGTASGKLKKLIMFDLVKRLGEDGCFRCGDRIESASELSVEHKLPWLDEDPALFWDLSNVAFSHLGCNVRAARQPRKIAYPEGYKWCGKCQQMKALEEFSPMARLNTVLGRRRACNPCQAKKMARIRGAMV